jgi:hypothetical protein
VTTYDISALSDYEREAWARIQRWQAEQAQRTGRIPAPVRKRAKQVGELASKGWAAAPGSAQLNEIVGQVLAGGSQAVADAVAASLQRDRILRAARDAGSEAITLSDLRSLDLRVIDDILPSLNLRYAATSAATGAASGFVAGGGMAAIAGTGGVAAAPGALAVGGALAADVIATISLAARVVTHYAGYYGYDTREENEKAVLLAVIGVGVAGEGAAKQAALLHVRKVAMMIARRAAWKELGEEGVVKLVQILFARLGASLTKVKLAQALPVVGVAAGAGLNYSLMRKVATAASFMYRERFLIEKYGLDVHESDPDLSDVIGVDGMRDLAIEPPSDGSDMPPPEPDSA